MTFTFSSADEVDYAKLGMCPVCARRFTSGCEHSNTMEAQEWLAAYAAVETSRDNVDYFIRVVKETRAHPVDEAEQVNFTGVADPRTPVEKAADVDWQDEQATRADIRAGFQQW